MGTGYYILLANGFGAGLVLLNPRLYTDGVDIYGNPNNWWPKEDGDDKDTVIKRHGLLNLPPGEFAIVLFDA